MRDSSVATIVVVVLVVLVDFIVSGQKTLGG